MAFIKDSATITLLLKAWGQGDPAPLEALIERTYQALHDIARARLWDERPDHTLTPTALVNEAFIKIAGMSGLGLQSRVQFFALCGVIIRNILVSHARRRNRHKRGGGQHLERFDEENLMHRSAEELIALDDGLSDLAAVDPRKALVVEIRFFGGLTTEEAAEALAVSAPTIKRELRVAKSWLSNYIHRRYP